MMKIKNRKLMKKVSKQQTPKLLKNFTKYFGDAGKKYQNITVRMRKGLLAKFWL